jgi:uncharacterized repeat protein (TIGR01451 family)/fimbrial isopeptide formation D2 family protein
VIVVQSKDIFNKVFPGVTATVYSQSDLSVYNPWATKPTVGLDNNRDQLVLLDAGDTIADFVEYTFEGSTQPAFTNSVPILFPPSGPPEGNGYSYERCPAANDTNNADIDFLAHDNFTGGPPSPGVPCPPATGVDLRIAKTASAESVLAGNKVTFSIDWSNNGDGAFSSIVVTDTLPTGLTFISQSSTPAANFVASPGPGQPMQWTFVNQTTNVSGTITLVAKVDLTAPVNTPLVNTAGVLSGDQGRVEALDKLGDNFATASVTALAPDLKVESTWPGGVLQGADFTYVISATNIGTGDASGVVVSDTLPSGITFLPSGSTPPATQAPGLLTWKIGDLGAGASTAIVVHVQLGSAVPAQTQLENTITISGTPPDNVSALANNTEKKKLVVGVIPDLNVSVSNWPLPVPPDTKAKAAPGSEFCYNINYAYGPAGAPATSNIVIKDTLPAGLTLVKQTGAGLSFNNATSGDLIWTRAAMTAGQNGTITVCVKVSAKASTGLTVNNVATITGVFDATLTGNNIDTKALTFDRSKVYLPLVRR